MNVDCHWITTNLEAYFCDRLTAEEDRLARSHIETCATCRNEVEELKGVDLIVKRYFKRELSIARSPRPQRSRLVLGGAAAGVLAALIAVAVMLQIPVADKTPQADAVPAAAASTSAPTATVDKTSEAPGTIRAKPAIPDAVTTPNGTIAQPASGADFLVVDPAGYVRTLDDYRGYVLLVGVWSSNQPQAAANLERIYQAFGANARLRILGASNEQTGKPSGTTFPVVYNRGSNLWGAASGDFVLVDESGQLKLRGSLLSDIDRLSQTLQTTVR